MQGRFRAARCRWRPTRAHTGDHGGSFEKAYRQSPENAVARAIDAQLDKAGFEGERDRTGAMDSHYDQSEITLGVFIAGIARQVLNASPYSFDAQALAPGPWVSRTLGELEAEIVRLVTPVR
eukprot:Opistho-1_new@63623